MSAPSPESIGSEVIIFGPPSPRYTPPPPSPPGWPAAPRLPADSTGEYLRDVQGRLFKYTTAGNLQDVHTTLCQYMSTQTPDPQTGRLDLRLFSEHIATAIENKHPAVLSYLFSMRVGESSSFVNYALMFQSPAAIFQVFLDYGWDINELRVRSHVPVLGWVSFILK